MPARLVAPALALVVILAGCGGNHQPRIAHDDASQLIALTDRIASEGACAQAHDIPDVSSRAIRLVNQGRVPAELQEPLLTGVNALAAHHPRCVEPVQTTAPVVRAPKPEHQPHDHHGKHGEHGHDK
jgi:hypothetical protein